MHTFFMVTVGAGVASRAAAAEGHGAEVGLCSYYAVFFAAQDYQHPGMPDLRTPIQDARQIAQVLEQQYGFVTPRIYDNPTRQTIIDVLDGLEDQLSDCDSLVVYYGGHGVQNAHNQQGYWQPVDADPKSIANWVSNATIRDAVVKLPARHVLLVSDACFSGSLFRGGESAPDQGGGVGRLAEDKSRWLFTSGGDEPVVDTAYSEDMSVFAYFLRKELARSPDRYVLPYYLFRGVEKGVLGNARQHPKQGPFWNTGHEEGHMVLVASNRPRPSGQALAAGPVARVLEEPALVQGHTGSLDPVVVTNEQLAAAAGGMLVLGAAGTAALVRRRRRREDEELDAALEEAEQAAGQLEDPGQQGPAAAVPGPPAQRIPRRGEVGDPAGAAAGAAPRARRALSQLLVSMFSIPELQRLMTWHYEAVVHDLPTGGSLMNYAVATVESLSKRGEINAALFDLLVQERQRRAAEILEVRSQFGV